MLRILVAEDEPLIIKDYRLILESRGHEVTVSENGESCLETYMSALGGDKTHTWSLKKPPFDVVILDYRMPKKDGLETARDIVKLCPKQRIIFASAYARETQLESTRELHQVIELIQKPFDLSYLVEVVENTGVYERLAKINEKVIQLRKSSLMDDELAELGNIVRDGLRVAMSLRITDTELAQLLRGLDNIRAESHRRKLERTAESE